MKIIKQLLAIQDELIKIRGLGSVLKVTMLKCDLNIHHCHLLFCLSKKPFSCKAFFHFFILYWITRNEESQKVCSNIPTKCEVRLKHLKVCKIRQYFPLLMVLPAKCWYLTTGSAGPWAAGEGLKSSASCSAVGHVQESNPSFPLFLAPEWKLEKYKYRKVWGLLCIKGRVTGPKHDPLLQLSAIQKGWTRDSGTSVTAW